MEIYFDISNLESYIKTYYSDKAYFAEHNKMLTKHLDVFLNMSFEQIKSSMICLEWVKEIMQNGKNLPKCIGNAQFPPRPLPLRDTGHLDIASKKHSAVYCLDCEEVPELREKGNYLVGSIGEECDVIGSLLFDDDQYSKSLPTRRHFSRGLPWSALFNYTLPCTDLIITDSYVLCNEYIYSNNILPFIDQMLDRLRDTHVNIVLFGLEGFNSKKKDSNGMPIYITPKWEDIRARIKARLIPKNITANISFVVLKDESNFKQHDRHIFANYIYYTPGACLNFYNNADEFTSNGDSFTLLSLAKKDHYEEAFDFIDYMQLIINEIRSDARSGQVIAEPNPISNLSNYLTFN